MRGGRIVSGGTHYTTGTELRPVTVLSVNTDTKTATVRDNSGHVTQIRTDVMRAKGAAPEVGENWLIDKSNGIWSFHAVVGYDGTGGGRQTATYTTANLESGASEQGRVTLATGYRLLEIHTDVPARVRVYATPADQATDLSRSITADPAPGTAIMLDFLTVPVLLGQTLSPTVDGISTEDPVTKEIPITVTATNAGTVTVTFIWVRTE